MQNQRSNLLHAAIALWCFLKGSGRSDSDCESGPDFAVLLTVALTLLHSPSRPLLQGLLQRLQPLWFVSGRFLGVRSSVLLRQIAAGECGLVF
mmetsp:Transcript_116434/g.232145  ORF Transcript_116434/g.232145 Transcript_116434/m.232145 type:complete len:93 (-) Transcript_116434:50-328(-)